MKLKYILIAWITPALMLFIVFVAIPPAKKDHPDYLQQSFSPEKVWISEKGELRGADYYNLMVKSPSGEVFFYRNPEKTPIAEVYERFQLGQTIHVLYKADKTQGNMLMEITTKGENHPPILSFETTSAEYAKRKQTILIVTAAWILISNLIFFFISKFQKPNN